MGRWQWKYVFGKFRRTRISFIYFNCYGCYFRHWSPVRHLDSQQKTKTRFLVACMYFKRKNSNPSVEFGLVAFSHKELKYASGQPNVGVLTPSDTVNNAAVVLESWFTVTLTPDCWSQLDLWSRHRHGWWDWVSQCGTWTPVERRHSSCTYAQRHGKLSERQTRMI